MLFLEILPISTLAGRERDWRLVNLLNRPFTSLWTMVTGWTENYCRKGEINKEIKRVREKSERKAFFLFILFDRWTFEPLFKRPFLLLGESILSPSPALVGWIAVE